MVLAFCRRGSWRKFLVGHPVWRHYSSVTYPRRASLSRLGSNSKVCTTNHWDGLLARMCRTTRLAVAASLCSAVVGGCSAGALNQPMPLDARVIVETLAADELEGRLTGTEGIEKAADHIIEQLENLGAEPLPGQVAATCWSSIGYQLYAFPGRNN